MIYELDLIYKYVFKVCNNELTNLDPEQESQEYFAYTFNLNNQKVKFRIAKITPKKIGQFVSIWKRDKNGITKPHELNDEFAYWIIAVRKEMKLGVFIFNKTILIEKKILASKTAPGKRGMRVYPTWDLTESKHAEKTQLWQSEYFVEISNENKIDIAKAKKLLNLN